MKPSVEKYQNKTKTFNDRIPKKEGKNGHYI